MLQNLKVKTKIFTLSLILIAFILVIAGIGYKNISYTSQELASLYENNLLAVQYLNDNRNQARAIEANIYYIILNSEDKNKQNEKLGDIERRVKDYNSNFEKYKNSQLDKFEVDLIPKVEKALSEYREKRQEVLNLALAGQQKEAFIKYEEIKGIAESFQANLKELAMYNVKDAEEVKLQSDINYRKGLSIFIAIVALSIILGIIISLLIIENIITPLKTINTFAKRMEDSDFSVSISLSRKDEFGQIAAALNKAQNQVALLINEVLNSVQDINAGSEELSATVQEMTAELEGITNKTEGVALAAQEASAGAEEVSASAEEVDSSLEILSQHALDGSRKVELIKNKAVEIRDKSSSSFERIQRLHSEKESAILKALKKAEVVENIKVMADTISGISTQTNLLALNAAIEAARAGEQGKGFAVVAEQVRKLAEMSSAAVVQIQETIKEVKDAFSELKENSNEVLSFISKDINPQFINFVEVSTDYYNDADYFSLLSENIASMSGEINATMEQVSAAISDMAKQAQSSSENAEEIKTGTNESSIGMEQIAKTAQVQAEMAQKLSELVQKFKI